MKRFAVLSPLAVVCLAGFLGGGFLSFVKEIEGFQKPSMDAELPFVDAIVVLTGGSDRLSTGVDVLTRGVGKKLLISGVHQNLSMESVLKTTPAPKDLRSCCIVLGHTARSTAGNANETRDWMTSEGYHSMMLVTANYHMPRSLILFKTAMPHMPIVPYPVWPENVRMDAWWKSSGTLSLLITEYAKFLAARIILWMGSLR